MLDLHRTKKNQPVHVPLNNDALAAIHSLASWRERKGPIFRNQRHPDKIILSNDHWFKPLLEAARIRDIRGHDIRRTFASWLVQDEVPLDRVSKLLGQTGLTISRR
jgi:integrase